jgi:hypothetical protein
MVKSMFETYREMEDLLSVKVNISHHERDRIIVERLIAIRNAQVNNTELKNNFDKVIRFWLTEEEFEKHVIKGESLQ